MKTLSLCSAAALAFVLAGCGGGKAKLPPNEVAVTAVGAVRGAAAQQVVPSSGATLTSPDGRLKVEIPAGAVATSQMLSIQAITNEAPGGIGTAYRLGPEGTKFSQPVKVTFIYGDADLLGSEPLALKIAYQDAMGRWNAVKGLVRDETAKTVTVQTSHFSDWSLLQGWQLRPGMALTKAGGTVDLVVNNCANTLPGNDDAAELIFKCRPDPDFFTVDQWSANGVNNGNSSVGTIKPTDENAATYTAPGIAPAQNPVSVSATATDKATKRKTSLLSRIFIDAHPPLAGTITSTQKDGVQGLTVTTTATVKFVYDGSQERYQVDQPSTLKAKWDVLGTNNCEAHATFEGAIAKADGTIILTDLAYFPSGQTIGTFTGTTTCNGGGSEPFTVADNSIDWWPASPASVLLLKSDGSLNDGYTDQVSSGTQIVSAQWTLTPILTP